MLSLAVSPHAIAQGWPGVFDPQQLLSLHLQMAPADWTTLQNDVTESIEVPAQFWADGETPILVSVRRKDADPINAGTSYTKISLRIDLNDLVPGQEWRELKKLSLENGDDQNVIREGFAWQIQRLATGTHGYGYDAANAAWVRLFINGVDTGVYLNPEFRDKRFLENRGLYVEGQTWLYEIETPGITTWQLGVPTWSPTIETLCYAPFADVPSCAAPDLAVDLPQHIEVKGMLTLLAAGAFMADGDSLFGKSKNTWWADFAALGKRRYYPWDMDSAPPGKANASIYEPRNTSAYTDVLLADPAIRAQYSRIFNDLVCGPWSLASLNAELDREQATIASAVEADPNNQLGGSAAGEFDSLRSWVAERVPNVIGQIEGFEPCPSIQLTLNEVMASNATFLEDPAEPGEFPDWFEIHNPSVEAVDVGGVFVTDDPLDPMKYEIPLGTVIPALGHLVMYADDDGTQGPTHTNFKLGAGGGVLRLYDRNGVTLLDQVTFGLQVVDVAYGRHPDGDGPWDFVPVPTPGGPNPAHNPPPIVGMLQRDIARPRSGDPVNVTAPVFDDSTLAAVTLHYEAGQGAVLLAMFDDGAHGDGAASDGVFGASIAAHPDDTVVEYWVEATDDLGASGIAPLSAPNVGHVYVVGYPLPPLIVNEFMADNDTVVEDPDDPLAFDDWLEIYNAGPVAVSLDGFHLTDDLLSPTKYPLPPGLVVPANGHLRLWADGQPLQGADHLGFQLSAAGEQIAIADVDARGNVIVDAVTFGVQGIDQASGRCPDGFAAVEPLLTPTPGTANGGAAGCGAGSSLVFSGVASGGSVSVDVAGVLVTVSTYAGDGPHDVTFALAEAIDLDPSIGGLGFGASAVGPRLVSDGTVTFVSSTDPTIAVPEPEVIWQLSAGLLALLGLGRLRRMHRWRLRARARPGWRGAIEGLPHPSVSAPRHSLNASRASLGPTLWREHMKTLLAGLVLLVIVPTISARADDEALTLDQLLDRFGWSFETAEIRAEKVQDGFYVLFGLGGNIAVSIGDDGVLIVDDQFPQLMPKIVAAIQQLGGQRVDYVINTHWHFDHAEGNLSLGPSGATIISQANSRRMMQQSNLVDLVIAKYQQQAYPPDAVPTISFERRMQLYFNGEEIELVHPGAAHTTGDAAVIFRGRNAVHMGDVFNNTGYPFIDAGNGGGIDGMIAFCRNVLAEIPRDAVVIPGHGEIADVARLEAYTAMLQTVRDRIAVQVAAGASLEEVTASNPTRGFEESFGDPSASLGFLDRTYTSLKHLKPTKAAAD